MGNSSSDGPQPTAGAAPARVRDVLLLAWPSVLSFVCNSAYRVNDQFWVQDLGAEAHAALGPCTFLLTLNFAFYFLAVGGSLTLVARCTGAGDQKGRDAVIRHALLLSAFVATIVGVAGFSNIEFLTGGIGLVGKTAEFSQTYLGTIYAVTFPMALAPVVSTTFVAMGNTRLPLMLQLVAVGCNFVLNPVLIYGWGPIEGMGIAGAALATGLSRAVSAGLGLFFLVRLYSVRLFSFQGLSLRRLNQIARIGVPSCLSIVVYAGVYFALLRTTLSPLGDAVLGGLSIGFNAFEGVAFPFFLGIAVAGSSLVGRNLGAGCPEGAQQTVRSMRILALATGTLFTLIFWFAGPIIVALFTEDPGVAREAIRYVQILAASQLFVAYEVMHEKTLLGAGYTAPLFLVSVPGNVLRLPLAWFLATHLGLGAAGVWWAINLSTVLKSAVLAVIVQRGRWLRFRPEGVGAGG